MRYLAWFGVVFTTLITVIYIAVFTPIGNSFIKPFAQRAIDSKLEIKSNFSTFMFNTSEFDIVLDLSETNSIKVKGKYSLFLRSFDFTYQVAIQKLESFSSYASMPLRGVLYTNGTIKGDLASCNIDGKSDLIDSKTSYHIELIDLNPTAVVAKVKDAKLSSLLYMISKNPYASADIDLDINIKDLREHQMDGEIILKSKNGSIDPRYMKSDFDVTTPKATFAMDLSAKLKGDSVAYRYDLNSNLFKINSIGTIEPQTLRSDISYALNIQDLEVLKPLTGADIRGALKLEGEAKGDKEALSIKARSDIASSQSSIETTLKDFKPTYIKAKFQDLRVEKLLYMLKLPHYSDGILSIDADISDARASKLSGKVITTVGNGILDSAYFTKEYKLKEPMPKVNYNLEATTMLSGDMLDSAAIFTSNIAKIDISSAKFNIQESSLKSDYTLNIADLGKLFFITNQHLKGSFVANGEIDKAKDLEVTLHSNSTNGNLDLKLHNSDLSANISSLNTKKMLYMLSYPDLIDATLDAKINYNLDKRLGVFNGKLTDAKFEKNVPFDLIKQHLKVDMYREFFNGKVDAKIAQENITAMLDLNSINSSIKVKEAKIDSKKEQIYSDLTLRVKKDEVSTILSGDLNSPKVTIDLERFMKSKAGEKVNQAIEKEVDNLFKKLFK